jgi:hypothetical protein
VESIVDNIALEGSPNGNAGNVPVSTHTAFNLGYTIGNMCLPVINYFAGTSLNPVSSLSELQIVEVELVGNSGVAPTNTHNQQPTSVYSTNLIMVVGAGVLGITYAVVKSLSSS